MILTHLVLFSFLDGAGDSGGSPGVGDYPQRSSMALARNQRRRRCIRR